MLNTASTLKTFFSGFDLPAYTLDSVPDEVTLPYITYPLMEPEWNEQASFYCQVWYPKNRLGELLAKADEIVGEIGEMKEFEFGDEKGYLVLYPSTPLIQILSDDYSQSAYINLSINAYHMPGD
jgi:hypothetical protein